MRRKPDLLSLRLRAETLYQARIADRQADDVSLSIKESRLLLRDLELQKIELELQTEELCCQLLDLNAASSRYYNLYEMAPMGFCTINNDGLILDVNLRAAYLFGIDRSKLIKQSIARFIHKDDQDTFYLHTQQNFETGKPQSFELRLQRVDGSFLWVHLTHNVEYTEEDLLVARIGFVDITERKRVEEVLQSRTAFFEAIADSPSDGILVVDASGNKVFQNARLAKVWKLPPDIAESSDGRVQIKYVRTQTVNPKEFDERVTHLYAHPEETGHDDIELLDGTTLERFTAPVRSTRGDYYGRIWTFRDITERKLAEVAQRDLLNRLQKIASRIPGFVYQFRMRPDGTFSFPYASDGIYDLFGIRPEDVTEDGSKAFAFLDPEDDELLPSIFKSAADLSHWSREFKLIFEDGTQRWLAGNSLPERERDGSTLWHGYICDITAERAAADELKDAKHLLEEAQAVARMGNWSYDLITGHMFWSKQMFQLFGIPESDGEPDYRGTLALFHPDDAQIVSQAVAKASADGTPYSLVLRVGKRDEAVKHLRLEGRARWELTGNVTGLFGTVTDVTTEIEREEALQAARDQAEAANRAKSEFLANMSHEIRTPLTAILGFADILRDETGNGISLEHRRETIDTITNAGKHLMAIINDVLDLSKIEADKIVVERIEMSLPEVLRDVASLLRPRAVGKGLRLDVRLSSTVPDRVICDPTRLRQILMNLVGNATKFTEAGSVTMNAGVVTSGSGMSLHIDVDDTGPGMTIEQAELLFQPFEQADSTVTRSHGGTGLGLTISRRLSQLLGGSVTLTRTQLGKGSSFRVSLPLLPAPKAIWIERLDQAEEPSMPAPTPDKLSLTGRILLAEDGIDNQRLIAFHLKRAGAEVDIANNGLLAIELLEKAASQGFRYNLLLTDIQMPEMDGYTLTRHLRKAGNNIPIVALTAHALSEDRQKGFEAGCDDYLSKPLDKKKLLEVCAKHMR